MKQRLISRLHNVSGLSRQEKLRFLLPMETQVNRDGKVKQTDRLRHGPHAAAHRPQTGGHTNTVASHAVNRPAVFTEALKQGGGGGGVATQPILSANQDQVKDVPTQLTGGRVNRHTPELTLHVFLQFYSDVQRSKKDIQKGENM